MPHSPLSQILLLLAAAVMAVAAMRRLRLPPIIGYLTVGMVLGPFALAAASDGEITHLLAEYGVVFLVFTLGLEFSLPRLVAMKWEVLGLGGGQVIATAGIAATIAWLLDVSPTVAIVMGGAVAMSSTAIVVRQLKEQAEVNRTHGRLSVAILVFQDLAFVPFLALTSAITGGSVQAEGKVGEVAGNIAGEVVKGVGSHGTTATAMDAIFTTLLQGGLALLVMLAAGRWLLRPLFHEIARTRTPELFLLAVLLVALSSAWLTQYVGLSLALGAFLAGMMLAETEYRHQVEVVIRPFRDILLSLFFITIGMLLNLKLLWSEILLVSALVLALLIGKTLIVALLARRFAGSFFKALRTGLIVSVGGEFGFALLTILLQNRLVDGQIVQPLLAATILSMVLSPFIIRHNKQLARWILREHGPPQPTALAREHAGTRAVAEREHVLLCGFGRVGQNVARVLERMGYEYLAVDADPSRTRAARQAGDPVVYGDASDEEILETLGLNTTSIVVISFSNPALALRILQAVRKRRADVPVLVRTQDDSSLAQLQQSGATSVVPETFEAGLTLVWHALVLLGEPMPNVVKTIADIRANRYSLLRGVVERTAVDTTNQLMALREAQHTVVLPPGAWAVGRTIAEMKARGSNATVSAIRRDGIVGREPAPDTAFKEGDVVVLYGLPEELEHGETVLLMG